MATKVTMPQLGESVIEGTISVWLKREGDKVDLYEPILEIETDKVTTEATAEVAGTLLKILVPEGETIEVGTTLAFIGEPGEEIPADLTATVSMETDDPAEIEEAGPEQTINLVKPAAPVQSEITPGANGPSQAVASPYSGRISPVVGRIAGEHNVDLSLVLGTGRDGRITKKDILAYIEKRDAGQVLTSPLPTPTTRPPTPTVSPGEVVPLTNIRRVIAEHMVRSKHTSPHVTTVFDLDLQAVSLHRSANKAFFLRDGAKLTFTVYIISAIVQALKLHPMVNSTWTDNGILLKKEINVGMATAIDDGLIVPVIRNADGLSLLGLARSINDLADRARNNRLQPDEVQGGTFTLTNHGVSGSLFATPIINQPQCGILGVGKIEKRVKVINDAIAIRPMAYASLTFDHRILDGATADHFMSTFKGILENWG